MSNKALMNECISYFKNNKGFTRAFNKMKEKYRSLGSIGGTIKLTNLSFDEQEALTGFLGRDYLGKKSASIKLSQFQKALGRTKFAQLKMEDILSSYFGEEILSKSSEQKLYEEKRNMFFSSLIDFFEGTPGGNWLQYAVSSGENAYRTIVQRYDADSIKLRDDISSVCNAVNNLPCISNGKTRLPVFASRIARDPHAFDDSSPAGQLLLFALCHTFNTARPSNSEEKAELLYKAGILFDEVSNFVLCAGLMGYSTNTNIVHKTVSSSAEPNTEYFLNYNTSRLHPGWSGFYSSCEPVQATLLNLSRLDRLVSTSGRVFVVENPAVFSTILDNAPAENIPLVCTYGQLKLASFVLLDMLAKEGTAIYYSGDFDPEGLLIADRLKSRYPKNLILWRFTPEDYIKALSDKSISPMRLKKLDKLEDPQLVELAHTIRQKKSAGYQELISDRLIGDVLKL